MPVSWPTRSMSVHRFAARPASVEHDRAGGGGAQEHDRVRGQPGDVEDRGVGGLQRARGQLVEQRAGGGAEQRQRRVARREVGDRDARASSGRPRRRRSARRSCSRRRTRAITCSGETEHHHAPPASSASPGSTWPPVSWPTSVSSAYGLAAQLQLAEVGPVGEADGGVAQRQLAARRAEVGGDPPAVARDHRRAGLLQERLERAVGEDVGGRHARHGTRSQPNREATRSVSSRTARRVRPVEALERLDLDAGRGVAPRAGHRAVDEEGGHGLRDLRVEDPRAVLLGQQARCAARARAAWRPRSGAGARARACPGRGGGRPGRRAARRR